jgi:predicted nucleic acid-binding protein
MKINEKFILDTNIIIYSLDRNSKYYNFSKELIDQNKDIYLTAKSISEFVSVLSKMNLYNIIESELQNLIENFTILYPNKLSSLIFVDLVNKYKPIGNRVFDIEIISIMQAHSINKIATINIKDFQDIDGIEIIQPL